MNTFLLGRQRLLALATDAQGNIGFAKIGFEVQGIEILGVDQPAFLSVSPAVAFASPDDLLDEVGPVRWSVKDGSGFFSSPLNLSTDLLVTGTQVIDTSLIGLQVTTQSGGFAADFLAVVQDTPQGVKLGPITVPGTSAFGDRGWQGSGGFDGASVPTGSTFVDINITGITTKSTPAGGRAAGLRSHNDAANRTFFDFEGTEPGLYIFEVTVQVVYTDRDGTQRKNFTVSVGVFVGPDENMNGLVDKFEDYVNGLYKNFICKAADKDETPRTGEKRQQGLKETKELFERATSEPRFGYLEQSTSVVDGHLAGGTGVTDDGKKSVVVLTGLALTSVDPNLTHEQWTIKVMLHEMRHAAQQQRIRDGAKDKDGDGLDDVWDADKPCEKGPNNRDQEADANKFACDWVKKVKP